MVLNRRVSRCAVYAGLMGAMGAGALAAQAPRVEQGAAFYAQRCSPCHGDNLNNVSGGWSFDLRRLRPDEYERFVSP